MRNIFYQRRISGNIPKKQSMIWSALVIVISATCSRMNHIFSKILGMTSIFLTQMNHVMRWFIQTVTDGLWFCTLWAMWPWPEELELLRSLTGNTGSETCSVLNWYDHRTFALRLGICPKVEYLRRLFSWNHWWYSTLYPLLLHFLRCARKPFCSLPVRYIKRINSKRIICAPNFVYDNSSVLLKLSQPRCVKL